MAKKTYDFSYEVIEHIATISDKGRTKTLELKLISWNGQKPKFDLRTWEGDKALKGVTLSEDEMDNLREVINELQY